MEIARTEQVGEQVAEQVVKFLAGMKDKEWITKGLMEKIGL